MDITIIRHGQTDWNKKNLFQGRSDISLNPTGIKQAEELALCLKKEKIDMIFSSPLDRALQTAKIMNQFHNTPIFMEEQIIERSLGKLEGKCANDYNLPELWNQILNLSQKSNTSYDVESLDCLLRRCRQFLDNIILQYGTTCNNIYIVAHGSVNLALLLLLGQVDTSKPLSQFTIENCCCYTISNPHIVLK